MEVLVPQKRSTPPPTEPDADPTLSPSVSKQPRLDATLSSESAKPEVTVQGFKVPKAFRGIEEWGPTEIGPMETTYLSTQFEVDDSSEYKEALLALEGLLAKSAYPTRQHIRQLLSLCFFPLLFKPPTRTSAFARANLPSSKSSKIILPPFDQDPVNLSHKKLREEARKVLDDLISTNGVDVVCRSIKGYGMPKLSTKESITFEEDPFASTTSLASSPIPISAKTRNPKTVVAKGGKGKGKEKETSKTSGNKSDEDLALSDSDDVLAISAKRIGGTENLWDFLAGTTAKKQRVWTREQPIMDGGWEILRCFVDGWETEWKQNKQVAFCSDTPIKLLSLLRYFKPSATSPVAREISAKAFDVAFWPFTDSALPKSSLDEDSDDAESDDSLFSDDDKKGKGRGKSTAKGKGKKEDEEEAKFEGGMTLEEKKEVGIRLLCLIGECATVGHFDGKAALAEFVQRMKALDHASFPNFLELLSLHSAPSSQFLPRLLATYLESRSHPLSATTSLKIPSISSLSASTIAANPTSDVLTSPRKLALAASSSLSSLSSHPSDNQSQNQSLANITIPNQSDAEVEAEFWKTPEVDSKEFLILISRIPMEVPLPTTDQEKEGGGVGRKPKPPRVVSFDRASKAAECHRLVKEVLINSKVEGTDATQDVGAKAMARVKDVLQGVEEVVELAKKQTQKK